MLIGSTHGLNRSTRPVLPRKPLCAVTDKVAHRLSDQGTQCPKRTHHLHPRADTHANPRRSRGNEGKLPGWLRAQLVERSFALLKCSGNLGRMTLRGLANVSNWCWACGHSLARALPKGMADAIGWLLWPFLHLLMLIFSRNVNRIAQNGVATRVCRNRLGSRPDGDFSSLNSFSAGCLAPIPFFL